MIIVSGRLYVEPAAREEYLAGCQEIVAQARVADGCLDFSISADLLEPGRINIYERWESDEHLTRFRGSGPDSGQTVQILDAEVLRYQISGAGPA